MVSRVAEKIEFTTRETVMAFSFIIATMVAIALVQVGIISNPVVLGLLITFTIILIFIGHFLVKMKIISRAAVPLWYLFTFGLVMLLYGGVGQGLMPAAIVAAHATIAEIALVSALLYASVILSIAAAILIFYKYFKSYLRLRK